MQLTKKSKLDLKEGGGTGATEIDISQEDDDIESLKEYAERVTDEQPPSASDGVFSLIGKMLFFSERKSSSLRLCIPSSLVDDVFHLCHDNCGHQGHRRTYLSISLRYYFPRISKRVKVYINDCTICQTSKPSHDKALGLLHSIETITMDFCKDATYCVPYRVSNNEPYRVSYWTVI